RAAYLRSASARRGPNNTCRLGLRIRRLARARPPDRRAFVRESAGSGEEPRRQNNLIGLCEASHGCEPKRWMPNVARARKFYEETLGLKSSSVGNQGDSWWVEYDLPGGGCLICLARCPLFRGIAPITRAD